MQTEPVLALNRDERRTFRRLERAFRSLDRVSAHRARNRVVTETRTTSLGVASIAVRRRICAATLLIDLVDGRALRLAAFRARDARAAARLASDPSCRVGGVVWEQPLGWWVEVCTDTRATRVLGLVLDVDNGALTGPGTRA